MLWKYWTKINENIAHNEQLNKVPPFLGLENAVITWKHKACYERPTTTGNTVVMLKAECNKNFSPTQHFVPPYPVTLDLTEIILFSMYKGHTRKTEKSKWNCEFIWPKTTLFFPTALRSAYVALPVAFLSVGFTTSINNNNNNKKPSQYSEPPEHSILQHSTDH